MARRGDMAGASHASAMLKKLLALARIASCRYHNLHCKHVDAGGLTSRAPVFPQKEVVMDFVIFFAGIAAVACALYYLKKTNPNKPHAH